MAKSYDKTHRTDNNCHIPDLANVEKWWNEPGFTAVNIHFGVDMNINYIFIFFFYKFPVSKL